MAERYLWKADTCAQSNSCQTTHSTCLPSEMNSSPVPLPPLSPSLSNAFLSSLHSLHDGIRASQCKVINFLFSFSFRSYFYVIFHEYHSGTASNVFSFCADDANWTNHFSLPLYLSIIQMVEEHLATVCVCVCMCFFFVCVFLCMYAFFLCFFTLHSSLSLSFSYHLH